MAVLKELTLSSFYFEKVYVVLKELILTVTNLGGCGGLETTDI